MIACLDVHYFDGRAHAAAIVCEEWTSSQSVAEYTADCTEVAAYCAGEFYRRELNPLLSVIAKIQQSVNTFVIDGYCHLSIDRASGLGVHLQTALANQVLVVGVAKNRYRSTTHAYELFRRESRRPLFVTSIGMDYAAAARNVDAMAGEFRIPKLLKAVDRLARSER